MIVCEHGQLKRQCEICDLKDDLIDLRSKLWEIVGECMTGESDTEKIQRIEKLLLDTPAHNEMIRLQEENADLRERLRDIEEVYHKYYREDGDYGFTDNPVDYFSGVKCFAEDCWQAIKAALEGK